MRDLASYPVSFPYGATSPPYSSTRPHRGDDIAAPNLTPIIVAGTQIGLVGLTGVTTGYHCHIQEWDGSYGNTRQPQNEFKEGKVVNVDPNGTQGDGSFGKFITIQTADGWNDTYCHLSRIDVQLGQVISGEPMVDEGALKYLFKGFYDRDPTAAEYSKYVGKTYPSVIFEVANSQEYKDRYARLVKNFQDAQTLHNGFNEITAYVKK